METSTHPASAAEHRAAVLLPHLVRLWQEPAPFEGVARWLCDVARARRALLLDEASGAELGRFPSFDATSPSEPGRGAKASGPHLLRMRLKRARAVALLEGPWSQSGFEESERRLVAQLQSAIDTSLAGVRALEGLTLTPATVAALLDAMSEPAALLRGDDVVYPNLAARTGRIALERWLPEARRHSVDPNGPAPLVIAVAVAGCRTSEPAVPPVVALPPWLRDIGEFVELGLSDKEIAERTGKSLTTVKTAVQRLFRRLGVHSRHELVRRRWIRDHANGGGA